MPTYMSTYMRYVYLLDRLHMHTLIRTTAQLGIYVVRQTALLSACLLQLIGPMSGLV